MHNHHVTDFSALRIKRLLNEQRSCMPFLNQYGSLITAREPDMKFGSPSVVGGWDWNEHGSESVGYPAISVLESDLCVPDSEEI